MKKEISLIVKKYNKVYKGSPWYGNSLMSILNKVDAGKVFIKPSGKKTNSVAEITAHIIGWREFLLSRISKKHEFRLTQKDTFNWKRIDKNEKTAWKSLLKKLEENQNEILRILNESDDELLLMKVQNKKFKVKYLLEGVIQHDIYHIGQIAALNKTLSAKQAY
jgi:uncharacterized damage-inducible protein DinB